MGELLESKKLKPCPFCGGFEIHFRTDSAEKYKAVQDECRRQSGHAKPEPPKEVSEDDQ